MQTHKVWKYLSFISLIAAIGLSIYLTKHHYTLLYGMSDGKSFCSQSTAFDCDSVNISSFSEIGGIPVALYGVFAFFIQLLFLLGIFLLGEDEKSRPRRIYFALSVANLVFCIYLAFASWFILKTFCLYCFILYVLCLLIFATAYKLRDADTFKFKKIITEDFKSMAVLVLLLIVPLGSLMVHASIKDSISKDLDSIVLRAVNEWKENKKYDFYLEGAPGFGAASPQLTLVVFSDFKCPHCKKAAPSLHAFTNAHKDRVKLIYQNYPLDSTCNPKMQGSQHQESCFFTKAAICAHEQNKYMEVHDWIYAHQEVLNQNLLEKLILENNLDGTKLNQCMQDPKTATNVSDQIQRAESASIGGTPSVFANGKFLPYGFLIPVLERALEVKD